MTVFKLVWDIHKWIGIVIGAVLTITAVTGLLLLLKKDYDWIQPKTMRGTVDPNAELAPIQSVYDAVLALDRPEFRSVEDIDRIDFRPDKAVHKVRSRHDHLEVQVDAVTLEILSTAPRRSDWLEQLHDGSLIAEWFHDYLMPLVAVALAVLVVTGYFLWVWPKWIRKRSLLRRQGRGRTPPSRRRDARGTPGNHRQSAS